MLELRCPACRRANATPYGVAVDSVRCAECRAPLDEDVQVRYRVAGRDWSPQVHTDLVLRARGGSLRREMLLSEDGGPWFRAGERADVFRRGPRASAQVARPHVRRPHVQRGAQAPGSVETMAVLCKLLGVLLLLLAAGAFVLAATFGASEGFAFVLLLVVLGCAQISLGTRLRLGSAGARNVQVGLAVLAAIGYVNLLGAGAGGTFALLGGLFVAIPFLLLLNQEARAWFDGGSDQGS